MTRDAVTRLALACSLLLLACPKRVVVTKVVPKAFKLLADTPSRETTEITETRPELEVDTRDFERTPKVVATGETPLFSLPSGAVLKLYGDEAGQLGFAVDNALVLEVLKADGARVKTVVIGSIDPVSRGAETLDNVGRLAFSFDAGELDLTAIVPERDAFKLRATVIDVSGVGRVSDVFVRIEPRADVHDDLREQ